MRKAQQRVLPDCSFEEQQQQYAFRELGRGRSFGRSSRSRCRSLVVPLEVFVVRAFDYVAEIVFLIRQCIAEQH